MRLANLLGGAGKWRTSGPQVTPSAPRVRVAGKFFAIGASHWPLKGLTYGPFAPNCRGAFLPELPQVARDLGTFGSWGGRVFAFITARTKRSSTRRRPPVSACSWTCRGTSTAVSSRTGRPGPRRSGPCAGPRASWARTRRCSRSASAMRFRRTSCGSTGPVAWSGPSSNCSTPSRQERADCLFTYTNYPSTEFLTLAGQDFYCLNVYLDDGEALGRYLDHLQNVAGPLPSCWGNTGSTRSGTATAARRTCCGVRSAKSSATGWPGRSSFATRTIGTPAATPDRGLGVRRDRPGRASKARRRRAAPSGRVSRRPDERDLPAVSVVVCSYNGAATLRGVPAVADRLEYRGLRGDPGRRRLDRRHAVRSPAEFPAVNTSGRRTAA